MNLQVRIERLLGNRGYLESRNQIRAFLERHAVRADGEAVKPGQRVAPDSVTIDGEPVEPEHVTILFNKPPGYTVSHADKGGLVYDLLPRRFLLRKPRISAVGRLDKDASGLLLFSTDGKLIQQLTGPRRKVPKVYEVTLAEALKGDEADLFASGELVLHGETKPLASAQLDVTGERSARLTITEGRYHQIKRMFAATGNRVVTLHRTQLGPLALGDLEPGSWRHLIDDELAALQR